MGTTPPLPRLKLVPVTLKQAQQFVSDHHRHNIAPHRWKFGVGVALGSYLAGVAVAGRPVARMLDDGYTIEVVRTCTIGTRNANSMLYGAIVRAGSALGFTRFITYTQHDESGASLRAVGWECVAELPARGGWGCESRPRQDIGSSGVARNRWEKRV